ncbi:MAG: serine hydrolase domain-containing protein [Tahibacter sp.]
MTTITDVAPFAGNRFGKVSRASSSRPIHNAVVAIIFATATTITQSANAEIQARSQSALVDSIFAQYDKPDVPGCAVAVIRDGKIVYERGYGLASLEHRVPIQPGRTAFNIASATKQFTAASVLLLVRDGKLTLDDDVHKFIPELPDYGHTIAVRNLLHHTSGLRDYYTLLGLAFVSSVDFTTDAQTMATITRQKALDFEPGSAWGYSSSNYFLLGQIVQRVSGQPLRDFARDRIFTPLGMHNTQFLARYDQVVADVATGYQPLPESGYVVDMSNWMTAGPSGLRTTVEDLARWDSNFYTGNVGGAWLPEQLQVRGQLTDGTVIDYGRGLISEDYRGLESVSHDGSFAGYRAQLLRFPKEKFSVAVLCNTGQSSPSQFAEKVADIYLADKLKTTHVIPAANAKADVGHHTAISNQNRFVGTYWNRRQGSVRRIEMRDGKLFYVRSADSATELVPAGERRLLMKGTPRETELRFSAGPSGKRTLRVKIAGVGVMQGGASDLLEVSPYEATADQLKSNAGRFYSTELLTEWQLVALDDHLVLRDPRGQETALVPAFKDAFLLDDYLLRFNRDATGEVTGFFVDAGRAMNIRFERGRDPSDK